MVGKEFVLFRQSIFTINNFVAHSVGLLQVTLVVLLIIVLVINVMELKRKEKKYKYDD